MGLLIYSVKTAGHQCIINDTDGFWGPAFPKQNMFIHMVPTDVGVPGYTMPSTQPQRMLGQYVTHETRQKLAINFLATSLVHTNKY